MTHLAHLVDWRRGALGERIPDPVSTDAAQRALGQQEVDMTTRVHQEFESLSSAAQRTGLSIRTLRRRIANGDLPAYRNGARVIRVNPDDVDHLMVRIPTARELRQPRAG